jgi:FkbM family methyltransferase
MKRLLTLFFRFLGYEVKKGPQVISGTKVEYYFFKNHRWVMEYKFQTIIDIGANKGQFASRFRLLFPEAEIHSFEPIPQVYQELVGKFSQDAKFHAYNLGLGSDKGTFDFFQNDFSDSSSLLPMKDLHKESFPFTRNEKLIRIQVERLDSVAEGISLSQPLMVKIDVQGFEEQVILGGKNTLQQALLVIVEVSFVELYENQVYFDTIYSLLKDLGFRYAGNYDQLISPLNGSILQADAIFLNEKIASA